jgi:ketosteroid isomerase-like protein
MAPLHPNERLIRDWYEARERGDREAVRSAFAPGVRWHDPYPAPFGGDLEGADAVFRDIFDGAAGLGMVGGFHPHDVLANDVHAVALVEWWAEYRGRRMESREVAVFHVTDGLIDEVWFTTEDPAAAADFFS